MRRLWIGAALLVPTLAACSVGASTKSASSPQQGAPNRAVPYATTTAGAGDVAGATDPGRQPASTFALDVDTASYHYATNLIDQGTLPNRDQVRPEEFVNAFGQDYPEPDGDGFSVTAGGARMPGVDDQRLLRIGLRTRSEAEERPDAALTFVIDVSGSMGDPGKLDVVKDALRSLVDQLRPTDSVAIVTFNSSARTLRPMTRVSDRGDLRAAIDELEADGSTNLGAGLTRGYEVARAGFRPGATNRVVILSDGLANTGDTEAAGILRSVRDNAAKQITLLGVGVGRDYGDALMEQLADNGDGFTVYVTDADQARQVFADRLPAAVALRALDAKAQVTFDPETVATYRLIGYDDRALAASQFRDDQVDGGEVPAGFTVTALYAVTLRPGAEGHVADAHVRWLDPDTREASERAASVTVSDLDTPLAEASPRLRVNYVAAYFAEFLRHSPYAGDVNLTALAAMADRAAEETDDPAVADLADTIRRAARLT